MGAQHKLFSTRYFSVLLLSSLAVNTLALALPLMTMQVYDRILFNRSEDTMKVLVTGVIIASFIELILRSCRSMVTGLNGAQFEHEASLLAVRRLLESEPRNSMNRSTSILMQDIGSVVRLKDYYGGQMMITLLIDMPFILLFLALETYLAGFLVIVPCVVLVAFLLISWRQGRKLQAFMQQRERADNERYNFITDALNIIHSIKALCLEAPMVRRFEEVQRESGQLNYRIACLHGQAGSLGYGFSQFMTVAVLCAGAPLVVESHITTGTLIACVLLSGQIMQPLQRGLAIWIRMQDIMIAKKRLHSLVSLPKREFNTAESLITSPGDVHLQDVSFRYNGSSLLIRGVNLDIAPGDAIAITGASGAGKTTLLELIAGIFQPDSGAVMIGSMHASRIPVAERPRHVAYLPMYGMILRGSIMDNLTGFQPGMRSQARQVADMLGIERAVSLLPAGYDTPLEGHMTDVISPGLKQRISIARALLHKPRLILFDNADHGMDHESYAHIFELMARLKGKATLVLVSEDRNMLSLADHVLCLHEGNLSAVAAPAMFVSARKTATQAQG
jgi:ABC-type bacteriocin/lantibiotic exporter with double-glycine peptidase domain